MSSDDHPTTDRPVYSYDAKRGPLTTTYTYTVPDSQENDDPMHFAFEHDVESGLYRVKWADGHVDVFRDKPVCHLGLERDPDSGELRPALTRGSPTYLYLCRQEREVQ
jgi:hypothetical protein